MHDKYFAACLRDKRMLHEHGMDEWPDLEVLTRYVFDLEEGLRTLADAYGAELGKDVLGRWYVAPRDEEGL